MHVSSPFLFRCVRAENSLVSVGSMISLSKGTTSYSLQYAYMDLVKDNISLPCGIGGVQNNIYHLFLSNLLCYWMRQ